MDMVGVGGLHREAVSVIGAILQVGGQKGGNQSIMEYKWDVM